METNLANTILAISEVILAICGLIGLIVSVLHFSANTAKKDAEVDNRITTVEKSVVATADDINKIKENHLAHIQADMSKMGESISSINTSLGYINKKLGI
jgi:uncharacterized protein YoxC